MFILSILLVVSVLVNVYLVYSLIYRSNEYSYTESDINDMYIEYHKNINTMLDKAKEAQYE